MDFEYDSWNRIQSMTYPDNEVVSYSYDCGGNLFSMEGVKDNDSYVYIKEIYYNCYGQRSYMSYGNMTHTRYRYDALQRLDSLLSYTGTNTLMQRIKYTYDNVSNITGVSNTAAAIGTLGGNYTNVYSYDKLYRLTSAGSNYGAGYGLEMEYSAGGRLDNKKQDNPGQNLVFGYCPDVQPHAAKRIWNQNNDDLFDLQWDANGNLAQVNSCSSLSNYECSRYLFWSEGNRLNTVVDKSYYSYYGYDAAGERTLKYTGWNTAMDINADGMNSVATLENVTLYTSPYLVATNRGYTKHYYAGAERICAKIGSGGLDALTPLIGMNQVLQDNATSLFEDCRAQMEQRELPYTEIPCIQLTDGTDETALQKYEDVVGKKVIAIVGFKPDNFKNAMNASLTSTGTETARYFYHSDHLGSASWITDASGTPVQHLQYCPFGEPFVNQHTGTYQERFTFTGKERDEETSYGYFGARYMDADLLTGWLSVDPMADKYPSLSPYNYCAWNPVKLVDPDGNEAWKPDLDRNLIAEKGDNAWTLATYLNSTPEIAINMLKEQGYSVNSKGVLNLKEGDLFKVDHGYESTSSNINLGKMGNLIRQKAGSGIAEDLFTNFWNWGGDITLTGSQFAGILMYIKESGQSPSASDGNSKTINFYNSKEYALAFGRASITIDGKQRITGFSDTYDFDSKKFGVRSLSNEFKTRAVDAASKIFGNGKKFKVSYN